MRQIGSRTERAFATRPSGELLAEGARFSESISAISAVTLIPKGVYRFKNHEEANQQDAECLALAMARLYTERQK